MPRSLHDQIRAALNDAGLEPTDRLGVAFSGGYDSLVLAHALVCLANAGEGPDVAAIHVNHRLRPESDRDAQEVAALAERMGLPLDTAVVDVSPWCVWLGQGLESGARAARYAAIAEFALQRQLKWVATGHTLNDQAETVLMRLASGSSLDGLAGLRAITRRDVPRSPDGSTVVELSILRPMLAIKRADIEEYARQHDLKPVIDPSNEALDFRRNQIRHLVLPVLNEVFPGAVESIGRTAAGLLDDDDYLRHMTDALIESVTEATGGLVLIRRSLFRDEHPALQRRLLASAYYHLAGPLARLSRERLEAMRALANTGRNSARVELGAGIVALVDYDWLVCGPGAELESRLQARSGRPLLSGSFALASAGTRLIPLGNDWRLRLIRHKTDDDSSVTVRGRRPGDRLLRPDGRVVRLQDWLVNQKVPAYLRDVLPLLDVNGVIVWVAGVMAGPYEDAENGITAELIPAAGGG